MELSEMQSAQMMSWKQKRKRETETKPPLKSQVTINNLDMIISFSRASIRTRPHLTDAEERNTNSGTTPLSLDMGKVELKWEVQIRSKKYK